MWHIVIVLYLFIQPLISSLHYTSTNIGVLKYVCCQIQATGLQGRPTARRIINNLFNYFLGGGVAEERRSGNGWMARRFVTNTKCRWRLRLAYDSKGLSVDLRRKQYFHLICRTQPTSYSSTILNSSLRCHHINYHLYYIYIFLYVVCDIRHRPTDRTQKVNVANYLRTLYSTILQRIVHLCKSTVKPCSLFPLFPNSQHHPATCRHYFFHFNSVPASNIHSIPT